MKLNKKHSLKLKQTSVHEDITSTTLTTRTHALITVKTSIHEGITPTTLTTYKLTSITMKYLSFILEKQ